MMSLIVKVHRKFIICIDVEFHCELDAALNCYLFDFWFQLLSNDQNVGIILTLTVYYDLFQFGGTNVVHVPK